MAVKKDVLIAGGVVVVCIGLVVVALVATKKDKPQTPIADLSSTSSYPPATDTFATSSSSSSTSDPYGNGFNTSSSSSSGTSPLAPSPSPLDSSSSFGTTTSSPSSLTPSTGSSPLASGPESSPFGTATSTTSSTSLPPVTTTAAAATETAGGGTHTVAKGETLGDISAAHYGTAKHWRKIVEANPGLDAARLKIGQVLQIPAVEKSAPASTGAVASGADTYTVQKGDSYYTVAKKKLGAASRWRELERLNNIPAEDLKVGTVLKLPAAKEAATGGQTGQAATGAKTHIVGKGETLGDISKQYFGTTTKWKAIVEANPGVRPENLKVGQSLNIPDLPATTPANPGAAAPAGGNTYTVKAGDTLESIAAAHLGKKSAWKQLVEANPGLKPTSLRVGQQIVIPGAAATPATPTSPATSQPLDAGLPPLPGAGASPTPAAPAPLPPPTFKDDLFYSPYDKLPTAPGAAPAPGGPLGLSSASAPVSA